MADQPGESIDVQELARTRVPRRRHRYKETDPSWTPGEGFANTPVGFRPAVAVPLLPPHDDVGEPVKGSAEEATAAPDSSRADDHDEDDFDASRALSVLITAMVICVGLVLLFRLTAPSQVVTSGGFSGDALGPQGQSVQEYVAYADSTLSGTDDDLHWGLIAFGELLTAGDASARIGDVDLRVGSIVVGTGVLRGVPSPFEGRSLEQVFDTELEWATRNNGGITAPGISGVVAYGTRAQFEEIRTRVLAVEVLPADAHWGKISVTTLAPITTGAVESQQ